MTDRYLLIGASQASPAGKPRRWESSAPVEGSISMKSGKKHWFASLGHSLTSKIELAKMR